MAVNDLITFRKGIASQWISVNPILASGEPGYDLTNSILKIGDGVSNWVSLSGIGSTSVGGSSSSSVGVRGVISTTGTLSSFSVSGGYSAGYLDLFQNGVKLLSGNDFTATDGTSIILTNSVPSGTVLEYVSLGASLTSTNYTKLDSISSSFNGSSTSFGLAVSGTPYYPVSANTLGIYVGGVAQEPISSYSVSGSNIIFTEAPASGLTFWGVGYGTTAVATLNGIAPGSVSSPAISSSNDLTTGFYSPTSGSLAIASSGYDRFKIDNSGNALFGGQNVDNLRYVDIGNINNSSNAGSILRLVTTNVSGTNNISVDLVKYKNGQFAINNNETNSAAFTSFNIGNSERLRITSSGNVGIGTTVPSTLLDINNDKFRVRNSKTPSSPSDSGNQGDICWDSSYIYVCTSTNNWTRTPISVWSSDPYFSYVSLLLHMDGTGSSFTDSSLTPKTITASGNATQSATQSKWGGKAAYFDGTGDYLTADSSAMAFGTSDFVVEMWVYFNSIEGDYTGLFDARPSQGAYPTMLLDGSSIKFFTNSAFIINGGTVATGQWQHIALARSSGTTRLYLNGSQTGSSYTDANNYLSSVSPVIGSLFDGYGLNGYIDDLRVTIGSARGYTGSTITVPTAAFPDYNT